MKKIMFITFVMLIMLMTLLTGCTSSEIIETNLVVLAGNRSNNPKINYNYISKQILDTCLNYGSVSAVSIEGEPTVIFIEDIDVISKSHSSVKLLQIAEEQSNILVNAIASSYAKTEGADILESIYMASRIITSGDEEVKHIIIVDNGLSTSGVLNFTSANLLDTNPDYIVEQLKESNNLPDLSNVVIQWVGIGDVSPPQDELTMSNRNSLKKIWTAILTEAGADVSFSSDIQGTASNLDNYSLPPVEVVPIIQEPSVIGNIFLESEVIAFDESKLAFYPDSTKLVDSNNAVVVLQPVISYLNNNPDNRLLLAGSTATIPGALKECIQFSYLRAEVVKELLVSQGISSSRIETVGLGFGHNLSIMDLQIDGSLDENAAKKNRAVFIMKADSPKITEILNSVQG